MARLTKLLKGDRLATAGTVELIVAMLLVIHWAACGWNAVGTDWRCGEANIYFGHSEAAERDCNRASVWVATACPCTRPG